MFISRIYFIYLTSSYENKVELEKRKRNGTKQNDMTHPILIIMDYSSHKTNIRMRKCAMVMAELNHTTVI